MKKPYPKEVFVVHKQLPNEQKFAKQFLFDFTKKKFWIDEKDGDMILWLGGEEICRAMENCSTFVKRQDGTGFFKKGINVVVQDVKISEPSASGSTNMKDEDRCEKHSRFCF